MNQLLAAPGDMPTRSSLASRFIVRRAEFIGPNAAQARRCPAGHRLAGHRTLVRAALAYRQRQDQHVEQGCIRPVGAELSDRLPSPPGVGAIRKRVRWSYQQCSPLLAAAVQQLVMQGAGDPLAGAGAPHHDLRQCEGPRAVFPGESRFWLCGKPGPPLGLRAERPPPCLADCFSVVGAGDDEFEAGCGGIGVEAAHPPAAGGERIRLLLLAVGVAVDLLDRAADSAGVLWAVTAENERQMAGHDASAVSYRAANSSP